MTAVAVRPAPATPPEPGEIQPVEHEALHRTITGLVTGLPVLALGLAVWQAWDGLLRPGDLVVFAIVYVLTGLGVTVGFHRLFTHRSFKAQPGGARDPRGPRLGGDRGAGDLLGRRPPQAPRVLRPPGRSAQPARRPRRRCGRRAARPRCTPTWAGCSATTSAASRARYAPDLLADPTMRFVDRTFIVWALAGLALPFALGVAIGGSLRAGLTGLLWGGAVRIFVLHHVTYSINSICHVFGRRRFGTSDESRNVVLARAARPSASPGTTTTTPSRPRRAMASAAGSSIPPRWSSAALELCGLAWDVVRVAPERQRRAALPEPGEGG